MAIVPLFKNRNTNCQVVHGKYTFPFVGGRFWTDNKEKIAKLEKMAKIKDHGVYIDPNEPEIDTEAATPYDAMKKKIIEEYKAQQEELKDQGSSYTSPEKSAQHVTSTRDSEVNGLQKSAALTAAEKLKASQQVKQ